jgi:predicted ATPase
MNGHAIWFGPFRLLAEQRLLLEGDNPVRLGSRAFDILTALVERGGEVVGKELCWYQTGMLADQSRQHGLSLLSTFASRFQRVIALKGGDLDTGSRPLHASPKEIVDPNASFIVLTGLTEQAEALGHAGQIDEGLALLEAGIEQCETGWLTPELLRLKGELLLMQSASAGAEAAKSLFQQALDQAHRQEMLSWELRAATSLARLLRLQEHPADAIAHLRPVYNRFTEGFGTADRS